MMIPVVPVQLAKNEQISGGKGYLLTNLLKFFLAFWITSTYVSLLTIIWDFQLFYHSISTDALNVLKNREVHV